MEDIKSDSKCRNMTGYKALYIIPLNEVEALNFKDSKSKGIVISKDGHFAKLDVHDIKVQSSYENDFYKNKIAANFRSANDMAILFDKMSKNRFIIKVADNNGYTFIYGSKEEPLGFSHSFVCNANPKQAKEYQLTFSGNTTFPAYSIDN